MARAYDNRRAYWTVQLALLLAIVGPLILLSIYSYRSTELQLTEQALSRHEATAYLAAATLRERFDRHIGIGVSLANQETFMKLEAEGKPDEAISTHKFIPQEIASIDRLFLVDKDGIVVAETPETPATKGADLSSTDWFKAVNENGNPHVSHVYPRGTELPTNVIAIAVPVKNNGMLVMEITTETLLEWARSIDAGLGGFAYFVDNKGNLAAHPKYAPYGQIDNLSGMPHVQELRLGRGGIKIAEDDGRESIIAYEPVPFRWGVVIVQPVEYAFVPRGQSLRLVAFVYCIILAVNLMLALVIMRMSRTSKDAYLRERAFLEAAGEGILATDAKGNVIKINPQAEKMLGWLNDELIGKNFVETVPLENELGDRIPMTFRPLIYALKQGEVKITSTTPTFYLLKKDGARFPAAITASPLKADGKILGAVLVFRDITSEKEIDRAKSEFVSLASHQLLSPMSAVKGYANLLEEGDLGPVSEKQTSAIKNMNELVERMISLVNALLNVSRIELGTFAIEPAPTNVAETAENVMFELAALTAKKRIMITRAIAKDLPIINADPNLLRIIFQNLLNNAVKYTPEGGLVTLTVEKRPTVIFIKVADTGIGIPKAQQGKIFNKFFRADNARTTESDGNGLGLYITKSILDHSDGKIWFSSTEGAGSAFFVTIPLEGMKKKEGTKKLDYKG